MVMKGGEVESLKLVMAESASYQPQDSSVYLLELDT